MSDDKAICSHEEKPNYWVISKQSTPKNNPNNSDKSKDESKNDVKKTPECTICYLPISQRNEQVALEECGHIFHSRCIRVWMKQKRTCPFCAGFSLLPEEYPRLM